MKHTGPAIPFFVCALCFGASVPQLFPTPRQVVLRGEWLPLDSSVTILLADRPSAEDLYLARSLTAELSDRYGLALRTRRVGALPGRGPFILMGSTANPLVREYCRRHAVAAPPEREGYVLQVDRGVMVAGADARGAFYGLQSLRQLIGRSKDGVRVPGVLIRDWPYKPFRGIKLYLPGRENIAYFKRFVRDVAALYKYNALVIEMNAGMRFDRHPELNAGWIELSKDLNYTRRDHTPGPGGQFQDSANADTADGGVLEKEEVADLVRFARQQHMEVIPEIPSLTHSYYLLTRHRELAEVRDAEWPDTYCPLAQGVYELLFDVLDEYIDVMHPSMVHIGHDEWRIPLGVCPRCAGKDPGELFAADVHRIYTHLRAKGIGAAMYGDHLSEPVRGRRTQHEPNPGGTAYDKPGALSPEQVEKLIPKDILIFNWLWDGGSPLNRALGLGEQNEIALGKWGFRQVFANFEAHIEDFDRRSSRMGIMGGAPSSWAATNELNFGKDLMFDFLGCANLLWSTERLDPKRLAAVVQERLPEIRSRLSATPLPSRDCARTPLTTEPGQPVRVGEDVSSLIFVHACRQRARNRFAYFGTWNFADTADLLGWYEVVYEDGFVDSVPLRYGVNILEEDWPASPAPKSLAYQAEMMPQPDGKAYFGFEWINPRFGKAIREVRLRTASESNPVLLKAVSMVRKRTPPEPKPLRPAR